MGDRSPATLTIFAAPDENLAKVFALADEYGFGPEFEDEQDDPEEEATDLRGETIIDGEASCGIVDELGKQLIELGASFELYQDPVYEWAGELMIHVAGTTEPLYFHGECDAEGEPYVRAQKIEILLDEYGSDLGMLRSALSRSVGLDARAAVRELRAKADQT